MTTAQPILVLRHIYEPAVQLPRIALKPLKPNISIRDDLGPQTAVCTHCKARHWEGERSKSIGHFSTCCSQGKKLKHFTKPRGTPVFRLFGRLGHRLGSLIAAVNQRPVFAQTWLIDLAEATDTRLGPDGADTRAGWDMAKEWILQLCIPLGRRRRTHNHPPSSTEMARLICDSDTNTGDRGPQYLILQVHGDRCPDGRPKYTKSSARSIRSRCLSGTHYSSPRGQMASTPTFFFASSTKLGLPSPETESRAAMVSDCAS
ncbi:BQ5605_C022g09548 [Microbotryum silenes-dioicae]|uniref:BQ5605_C022g09548 protein n=1 Tax=Microbotryum silenes-dioicae TaxID=796604 RepID=A0A2X0MP62_9BASI|nr:BQ5605_C022g09548 [Microbotryum silenes-dioicae]